MRSIKPSQKLPQTIKEETTLEAKSVIIAFETRSESQKVDFLQKIEHKGKDRSTK